MRRRLLLLAAIAAIVLPVTPAEAAPPKTSTPIVAEARQRAQTFVEWGGSYWEADILQANQDGSFLIHYVGWGSEYDEVVAPKRLKRRAEKHGRLFVEWGGSFWPTSVLAVLRDGRVRIHYDGWDSSWDETVERSRLVTLE